MRPLRVLTGSLLALAAIGGLIFSIAAIIRVPRISGAASKQSTNILGSTKEAVTFLQKGSTKAYAILRQTKVQAEALDATLAEISRKIDNTPTGKALLDTLDDRIAKQLHRAQLTLVGLQASLHDFHNALVLFNSIGALGKVDEASAAKEPDGTEALSGALVEASEALDHIVYFLNEVMTDREVTRKSLSEVQVRVRQVRNGLADAESRVNSFRQQLGATEDRLREMQHAVPEMIDWSTLYAVTFLTFFAFTQVGLLIQAGWLLRESRA